MKKNCLAWIMVFCFCSGAYGALLQDFRHCNTASWGSAEALLAGGDDPCSLKTAPASLAGIKAMSVSFGYMSWLELVDFFSFSWAWNLADRGLGGVVGVSFDSALLDLENYSESGAYLGRLKSNEWDLILGYAFPLKGLDIGIDLTYLRLNPGDYAGSYLALGWSVLYSVSFPGLSLPKGVKNFSLAAGFQNLSLSSPALDKKETSIPVYALAGLNYNFLKYGELNFRFLSALTTYLKQEQNTFSVGLISDYRETIFLRLGYYVSGGEILDFSAGFGVQSRLSGRTRLSLDYGLLPSAGEMNHCLSVRFDF